LAPLRRARPRRKRPLLGLERTRSACGRVRPAVPIVITTGYSSSADPALREGFLVLRKPYDLASLRRMFVAAVHGKEAAAAAS